MNLTKGKNRIEIVQDAKTDIWLNVKYFDAKNAFKHSYTIVGKDLESWLTYLGNTGWKKKPTMDA